MASLGGRGRHQVKGEGEDDGVAKVSVTSMGASLGYIIQFGSRLYQS